MSTDRSYLPKPKGSDRKTTHFHDADFEHKYPALAQLLGDTRDDEGKEREPASISLFVGEGKLKAAINDKHTGMTFWTTLGAPEDVLGQLEVNIREAAGEWKKAKESRYSR